MSANDTLSEGECLDDSLEAREDLWDIQEMLFGHSARSLLSGGRLNILNKYRDSDVTIYIEKLKLAYNKAKTAKIGTKILCATCGQEITKKTYAQVFCCAKEKGNCKDKYWNSIDEKRRERAKIYKKKMKKR